MVCSSERHCIGFLCSGPTVTIRSAPRQSPHGKDGNKSSLSVWSSSSHTSSAPSRESELVNQQVGPSNVHGINHSHSYKTSKPNSTAFPGLDEAVTLISQQDKEEARNRKRQKEGKSKISRIRSLRT